MQLKSNSNYLRGQRVIDAMTDSTRVAALAAKFDALHLEVEQNPTTAGKKKKLKAREKLEAAVNEFMLQAA